MLWQTDEISRTFDYEPFVQTFVRALQAEGLLDGVLSNGSAATTTSPTTSKASNGARKKARKK